MIWPLPEFWFRIRISHCNRKLVPKGTMRDIPASSSSRSVIEYCNHLIVTYDNEPQRPPTDLSSPKLSGPYPVLFEGTLCNYFRIPNFAIRGNNRVITNKASPLECANACNREAFCNSFEYKCDGACNLNEADVLEPDLIFSWNILDSWDYWQVQDCISASEDDEIFAAGLAVTSLPRQSCPAGAELEALAMAGSNGTRRVDVDARPRGYNRLKGRMWRRRRWEVCRCCCCFFITPRQWNRWQKILHFTQRQFETGFSFAEFLAASVAGSVSQIVLPHQAGSAPLFFPTPSGRSSNTRGGRRLKALFQLLAEKKETDAEAAVKDWKSTVNVSCTFLRFIFYSYRGKQVFECVIIVTLGIAG